MNVRGTPNETLAMTLTNEFNKSYRHLNAYILVFNIIAMIPNVYCAVFIQIEHDMIELDTEALFNLILYCSQHRRVLIFHIDDLAAVLEHQFRVGRIC